MVPSLSQRPGPFVRPQDTQIVVPVEAAGIVASAASVRTAALSVTKVVPVSRPAETQAQENALTRPPEAPMLLQDVSGYAWALSPDGKTLILSNPAGPARPERQIAPIMLQDVESVRYRETSSKREPEAAAPSAPEAAKAEPVRSEGEAAPVRTEPIPTPAKGADAAPAPPARAPEPAPSQRFLEADASA